MRPSRTGESSLPSARITSRNNRTTLTSLPHHLHKPIQRPLQLPRQRPHQPHRIPRIRIRVSGHRHQLASGPDGYDDVERPALPGIPYRIRRTPQHCHDRLFVPFDFPDTNLKRLGQAACHLAQPVRVGSTAQAPKTARGYTSAAAVTNWQVALTVRMTSNAQRSPASPAAAVRIGRLGAVPRPERGARRRRRSRQRLTRAAAALRSVHGAAGRCLAPRHARSHRACTPAPRPSCPRLTEVAEVPAEFLGGEAGVDQIAQGRWLSHFIGAASKRTRQWAGIQCQAYITFCELRLT